MFIMGFVIVSFAEQEKHAAEVTELQGELKLRLDQNERLSKELKDVQKRSEEARQASSERFE